MNLIVLYLLKANALLVVFWLFYRLFLRKETFYNSIRWYFISSLLLSFVLPLITYTKTVIIEQTSVFNDSNWENSPLSEVMTVQSQPSFWETINWQSVVLYALLAISICCVVKSLYQIIKLYISIKKLPVLNNSQIKVADHQQNIYSFYQWIVVPENKLSAADLEMILAHEKIHLNQKHTFDLIFIELVSAVFWFNPLVKKLQKDINTNLEFIVDEKMIALYEPVLYQKSLLNEHCNYTLKYINAFNTSDLKKRIIQLNTQKSKNMKKLKFLATAPVLVTFFALFQIETVAQIQTIEVQEVSENDEKKDQFYIQIHSKYDDAYYERTAKMLKDKYNLDVKFYNLKRNKNGELTSLAISYYSNNIRNTMGSYFSENNTPIEPYELYVYKKDNEYFIEKKLEKDEKVETAVVVIDEVETQNQFSFNAETLKLDRKVFDEVVKRYPITVDEVPMTKKQLKKFDNSKIQSMSLDINQTGKKNVTTVNLFTKMPEIYVNKQKTDLEKDIEILLSDRKAFDRVASKYPIYVDDVLMTKKQLKKFDTKKIRSVYVDKDVTKIKLTTKTSDTETFFFKIADDNNSTEKFNGEGSIKINGKNATLEELKQHIDTENKKKDSLFVVKKVQIQKKNDEVTHVTLKGIGSVSNKNIVYIVDGKEMKPEDFGKIKPGDIERIDVLKDKKAIEKYGDKAKDGVIIVTTKYKKEVSLQQKAVALKARELAIQKRERVINESKEKILQRKIERENLRKELTTKKDEIQKNAEHRKREIEKLKQEQEKLRKNHKYVTVSNKGDGKLLEKDYETVNAIFKDLKDIKKIEDENIKITSISASITRDDGTKIEIVEKY